MTCQSDALVLLMFLAFLYIILVTSVYPYIERFIRDEPPESTLEGSDRGSYRDYLNFPELYDQQTGYRCACYKKNRFYRDGKCWEFYRRGGKGLGFNGLKPCY